MRRQPPRRQPYHRSQSSLVHGDRDPATEGCSRSGPVGRARDSRAPVRSTPANGRRPLVRPDGAKHPYELCRRCCAHLQARVREVVLHGRGRELADLPVDLDRLVVRPERRDDGGHRPSVGSHRCKAGSFGRVVGHARGRSASGAAGAPVDQLASARRWLDRTFGSDRSCRVGIQMNRHWRTQWTRSLRAVLG